MVADSKSSPSPTPPEETGNINHRRCGANTKNGRPCGGRPSESGTCFAHDPALSATREAARVRGGENSSSRARLEKLMPERLLATVERLVKAGRGVDDVGVDPCGAEVRELLAGAQTQ